MLIDPRQLSADAAYRWMTSTILPRPIAWTSTLNENGTANLAPFSYFSGVSADPPTCLICVSRRGAEKKDTWRNIERTGEYVIHLVTFERAELMNQTSADHPYGVDEFDLVGLPKAKSERVSVPRIADAPVAFECRLLNIYEVGRSPAAVIIGEILLWHVRDELVVGGRLDLERLDPVGRLGGADYARSRERFALGRPSLDSGTP